MSDYTFLSLPINPNEGFPQAFRLAFNGRTYQFLLYANIAEELLGDDETVVYELPAPGAFLVLRVVREITGGSELIFRRRLVRDVDFLAGELVLRFTQMRVARRNLNGVGVFGSQITGGIAARWAS